MLELLALLEIVKEKMRPFFYSASEELESMLLSSTAILASADSVQRAFNIAKRSMAITTDYSGRLGGSPHLKKRAARLNRANLLSLGVL